MSLSDTWKAPLDLLEQELWTVEQGLHVSLGYFKTTDLFHWDILDPEYSGWSEEFSERVKQHAIEEGKSTSNMRDLNIYYLIATGETVKEHVKKYPDTKEAQDEQAIENIEISLDQPVRLWLNSDHDKSELKEDVPAGESYFGQKWTKTYFIQWALRHRFELPWLDDAIKEGYVTGIVQTEEESQVSYPLIRSDLQEYLIEIVKSDPEITAGKLLKRFYDDLPDCITDVDTKSSKKQKDWIVHYKTKEEGEKELGYDAFNAKLNRAKNQVNLKS